MSFFGKILIITGLVFVFVGIILVFNIKIPYLGKLPGDIYIKKENFTFYFPLSTSIVLSVLLSFILWLISKK
ncbi:MAG: DUF2905 domain-containing protein [Elusimicrobia bacterium]|nr:DUF2905 domain-containing protein [Elusimicrobiota bacterium]